jgi:FAD/FMN-containing dehydrogenase
LLLPASDPIVTAASTDWTGHYGPAPARLLLRPQTTAQVSALLRYCHERRLPIVPQGGKTGLVGGSVPTRAHQEIILQLQQMNQITALDPLMGIVTCQAGVVLQNLQDYCARQNWLVPLDLGAKGTCQIGGNLSTNAGGPYFRKYGSLAGNVLGLEVVLADGRILDYNYRQRNNLKDNTGYKWHQLFLGSEGTLGIITGVTLACAPLPRSKQAAFVACASYNQVLLVLQKARQYLGEILAAMEFMDAAIWTLVEASGRHKMPLSAETLRSDSAVQEGGPFFLLIDTHGSNADHDQEKWQTFLEAVENDILNGVLAQDMKQYQSFWQIRESANPTVAQLGYTYKYDVSLPIAQFQDWIQEMRLERMRPLDRNESSLVNANWGHILDGNLHFNLTTIGEREAQKDLLNALEPYVFHSILKRGGSISAEHGLGQAKNHLLHSVHDETTLDWMRSMKTLLDPKMILNPGKFLPSTHRSRTLVLV